jgi:hypothetical protein
MENMLTYLHVNLHAINVNMLACVHVNMHISYVKNAYMLAYSLVYAMLTKLHACVPSCKMLRSRTDKKEDKSFFIYKTKPEVKNLMIQSL